MTAATYADEFCVRLDMEKVPMPQWFQRALDEIQHLAARIELNGKATAILESEVAGYMKENDAARSELEEVRKELRKISLQHSYSLQEERHLQAERDEARRLAEEACNRYNELLAQPGRVTCVFCGHQYEDGTPASGDQRLVEHVKVCPKHPMRRLEREYVAICEKKQAEIERLRDTESRLENAREILREQGQTDHARAEHLERLFQFLCGECLDLRCQSAPIADTGDSDIWWDVIEHQMAEPHEVRIGSGPSPIEAIQSAMRSCRICGCTDLDCSVCIERTGEPCHWVEEDLCSACAAQEGQA
jgi:hypothetical protein